MLRRVKRKKEIITRKAAVKITKEQWREYAANMRKQQLQPLPFDKWLTATRPIAPKVEAQEHEPV
jgi:hypothetical protein